MNSMIFFFVLFGIAHAATAPTFEKAHGAKMLVQYFIYNAGLHSLVVQEKLGDGTLKETQKVRMFLKKDEFVTNQYSFSCETKEKELVYAVALKKKASKKKAFKPSRGWIVDEAAATLEVVKNPELVSCKWKPSGDEKYPFK